MLEKIKVLSSPSSREKYSSLEPNFKISRQKSKKIWKRLKKFKLNKLMWSKKDK